MSSPTHNQLNLQRRMSELGRRYLERTASDLQELQGLVADIPTSNDTAYKRIEIVAHRMRGSGAMFGFDLIADATLGIEMLAVDAQRGLYTDRAAVQTRFDASVRLLDFVLRATQEK